MKRNLTITKVLLGLIGLTLTSCSIWHYNMPRVSVDREKATYVNTTNNLPVEMANIPQSRLMGNNNIELNTIPYTSSNKVEEIKVNNNTTTSLVNTGDSKVKSPFKMFADHVKIQNKKTCKIEGTQKSAASGWVRIMIILFAVGLILLLVGIFLSVFLFGPFWWLFYAFGALLILAGFIVLILGLLGLI